MTINASTKSRGLYSRPSVSDNNITLCNFFIINKLSAKIVSLAFFFVTLLSGNKEHLFLVNTILFYLNKEFIIILYSSFNIQNGTLYFKVTDAKRKETPFYHNSVCIP